ncbi:hypothetical protein KDL44_10555 [bacterium]|nr:hypothetical protein [bacterium]
MKNRDKQGGLRLAPEALFIFGLVAVLGYFAVWRAFNPPGVFTPDLQGRAEQDLQDRLEKQLEQPPVIDSPVRDELAQFYAQLATVKPTYIGRPVNCPLDNTALQLPVMKLNEQGMHMDNAVGGIASDFMKIAVGPPVGASAMPDLLVQQWEQLPVSCPQCRNTYQEQDLNNLRHPERLQALRDNWELERLSPGLAAIPLADWTPDLVQYGHYLSMRAAANEHIELGWTALSGAYASNFSVWSGEHDYYVPSAAFYALAAAEFQTAIDLDWEGLPQKSRAETVMALLVCQRLLGREAAARETIALAREVLQNEPAMLPALDMEEGYLNDGHFALERVNLGNRPAPIIGWQLDLMLAPMNGHISQFRADWQDLTDVDRILEAMDARIAEIHQQRSAAGTEQAWNSGS